uniref:Salivary lipocalin n=1 Tax=Caenorhabditis tropicalis TaxID=1561998 RepID=A0A1I7TGT9_9PELO
MFRGSLFLLLTLFVLGWTIGEARPSETSPSYEEELQNDAFENLMKIVDEQGRIADQKQKDKNLAYRDREYVEKTTTTS